MRKALVFSSALFFAFGMEAALADQSPVSTPPPTPTTAPASSPIGPALFANDPCTSLSEIVTRPTVTNSVCTVRPGHVLTETGYQNVSASGGGNSVTYPQTFVRIGTSVRSLEAEFTPPSYQHITAGGTMLSGPTDAAIGLKYVAGATSKFAWGASSSLSLATGATGITSNGSNVNGALNWTYALSPVFSLSGTFAGQSTTNGTQRWGQFIPSFLVGASLPANSGLFAEVSAFTNAVGAGSPTRAQYIVGALHDFSARVQADVECGFSPTVGTGKYSYVGVGLSYYH